MGYNRISTDGVPIENLEGQLLSSAARTATATADFINGGARDLYAIVNVTSVGTVAGVAEVSQLVVTAFPTAVGNVTVTLNGVGVNIAVDPAVQTDTTLTATAIRGGTYAGWTTGGAGTTVTFTATSTGTRTDIAFSGAATGVTATLSTPTQGVTAVAAPSLTPKVEGKAWTSGAFYSLGTAATPITATGLYVYMYSKNAGTAHDGITAVYDSPIPKTMRFTMTHGNATTITYSVDYALCL
jgi:hypothetical protein